MEDEKNLLEFLPSEEIVKQVIEVEKKLFNDFNSVYDLQRTSRALGQRVYGAIGTFFHRLPYSSLDEKIVMTSDKKFTSDFEEILEDFIFKHLYISRTNHIFEKLSEEFYDWASNNVHYQNFWNLYIDNEKRLIKRIDKENNEMIELKEE